ncbi:MAG: hypothetical protein IT342_19000 [Candidatus Melainabacteria bacterium]|nr:hypothetical protein [Candidatus Melainabacteria bacterium]
MSTNHAVGLRSVLTLAACSLLAFGCAKQLPPDAKSFSQVIENCVVEEGRVLLKNRALPFLATSGRTGLYHEFCQSQSWKQLAAEYHYKSGPVGFCIESISEKSAIVMGGYLPGEGSPNYDHSQTWIWNRASDTITQGPPMREAHWFAASCRLDDGKIFVSGGYNGKNLLNGCEIYSPGKGFERTTSLCVERDRHTVVPIGPRTLIVVGGEVHNGYTRDVEVIQIGKSAKILGQLSVDRIDACVAKSGTAKLLVCGGKNFDTSDELPAEEFNLPSL